MGRIVPEIGDEELRELIYRQYRIVYIVGETDEHDDWASRAKS